MVAEQYSTDHHEYLLSADEAADSIEPVLHAFDEPFSGVTSTYFLTKLISKHVKVALSGDGADELFGSYLAHRLAQPLEVRLRLNQDAQKPSQADVENLKPFEQRLDYLDQLLAIEDEASRRLSLHLWDDAGKSKLVTDRFRALARCVTTRDLVANVFQTARTTDALNRALYYDFETLLPDQVLPFVDRLSMAHSVEVRPPFLDHRLVEFAATIPGHMKIRGGREKHILKEAVRGLLPDEILARKKEGFVLPVDKWLLGELRPRVEAALSPGRLRTHGLLVPDTVSRLLADHFSSKANHGPRIWNLLMFQTWWEKTYGGV
jgi:asparagine synthase (glutamine-hydrolysing)